MTKEKMRMATEKWMQQIVKAHKENQENKGFKVLREKLVPKDHEERQERRVLLDPKAILVLKARRGLLDPKAILVLKARRGLLVRKALMAHKA